MSTSRQQIKRLMDMFEDWKRIYQNRMKAESYDLRTAELWAIVIQSHGLSLAEFNTAYQTSLIPHLVNKNGFPPSSVEDFIELVRPNVMNEYPDVQTAFEIACVQCGKQVDVERNWRNEVVRETANRIGWGKLACCTVGYVKQFVRVYQQVVAEHQAGATFTVPETHRIADDGGKPIDWNSEKGREIDAFLKQFTKRGIVRA